MNVSHICNVSYNHKFLIAYATIIFFITLMQLIAIHNFMKIIFHFEGTIAMILNKEKFSFVGEIAHFLILVCFFPLSLSYWYFFARSGASFSINISYELWEQILSIVMSKNYKRKNTENAIRKKGGKIY